MSDKTAAKPEAKSLQKDIGNELFAGACTLDASTRPIGRDTLPPHLKKPEGGATKATVAQPVVEPLVTLQTDSPCGVREDTLPPRRPLIEEPILLAKSIPCGIRDDTLPPPLNPIPVIEQPISKSTDSSCGVREDTLPPNARKSSSPIAKKVKSTPPVQEKKSTPPVQEKKSTPPVQEKKSTPPVQEKKSTPPVQEKKSTPPAQEKKSTPPAQEKKAAAQAPIEEKITLEKSSACGVRKDTLPPSVRAKKTEPRVEESIKKDTARLIGEDNLALARRQHTARAAKPTSRIKMSENEADNKVEEVPKKAEVEEDGDDLAEAVGGVLQRACSGMRSVCGCTCAAARRAAALVVAGLRLASSLLGAGLFLLFVYLLAEYALSPVSADEVSGFSGQLQHYFSSISLPLLPLGSAYLLNSVKRSDVHAAFIDETMRQLTLLVLLAFSAAAQEQTCLPHCFHALSIVCTAYSAAFWVSLGYGGVKIRRAFSRPPAIILSLFIVQLSASTLCKALGCDLDVESSDAASQTSGGWF